MQNLQDYGNQVERAVKDYKRGVERIEESDNPYYQDKKVKDYEIKQLRGELESKVEDIKAKHAKAAEQAVADAKETAARSYFYVGETDKKLANHHLDSFVADVALASNDDQKAEAYGKLERNLEYLSPAQLDHVRKSLPYAMQNVGGDKTTEKNLRGLNSTLANLKTPEQEALEDVQAQAKTQPDGAFRRLRITHRTYSDYKDNRSGGTGVGEIADGDDAKMQRMLNER